MGRSRLKNHFDFTEKRLEEDFIKLADEIVTKISHCKKLLRMNLLPITSGDTGIKEMQVANNILFTLSKLKEIKYEAQLEAKRAKISKKRYKQV